MRQGKYEEAESLLKHALAIWEQHLGEKHPDTAAGLNNLGQLYMRQGRYEEAEAVFQRALVICEQVLEPEYPLTLLVRKLYSALRQTMERDAEAT